MSALALMEAARAGLMLEQPFYASLSLMLELVEDPTCKTAWVDGRRLGFNGPFVESLSPSERRFLVAHEVGHCARLHHVRRGNRELKTWNEACDFSINPELIAAGMNMPEGGLLDPSYSDLSEEEIFRALKAKQEKEEEERKNGDKGQGKPDNGPQGAQNGAQSGKGGNPGKGAALGEVRDAAPAHDAAALTQSEIDWRTNVRQALAVARAKGAGKLPGYLEELDAITAAPRIDWKPELRAFIDQSSVKAPSWSRPNKRYLSQGLILPGMVSDSLSHLVMIVDDSYSIDMEAFNAIRTEAAAALDEGAADKITVVFCNVAVHRVETFERGDDMQLTTRGGGGTKFSPAFAWVEENAPDASAIVYLTDLDCKDFGPEPSAPVLWVAYGPLKTIAKRAASVPFGQVLPLAA